MRTGRIENNKLLAEIKSKRQSPPRLASISKFYK